MADIEIALAHLDEAKKIPRREECVRQIREAYAERYLTSIGVDTNARCRSLQREVLRRAPLSECQIEGAWNNRGSAVIDRLRIRQPRLGEEDVENEEEEHAELEEAEGQISHSRVGHTGYIKPLLGWVNPYQINAPGPRTTRELPFLGGGTCAWLPTSETDIDLTHELERVRMQARRRGVAPGSTVDGQAKTSSLLLGSLTEKRLQELKRKFLLPFASQRLVNGKLVVVPWLPRAPKPLQVPDNQLRQARAPVNASVEDIKKATVRLVKGQHQSVPAVFGDVCEVATGSAFDFRSGQSVTVPRCDILVAGYSCKDISVLNNDPATVDDVTRGTGQTLQAALSYISCNEPTIVILENVQTMYQVRSVDKGQKPVTYLVTQMKRRGYVGPDSQLLLNSLQFGLPQSRPRAWMVFFHAEQLNGAQTLAQLVPDRIFAPQHRPWPLQMLLAEDADLPEGRHSRPMTLQDLRAPLRKASDSGKKWVGHLTSFMEEAEISEQQLLEQVNHLQRWSVAAMPASLQQSCDQLVVG
ncbi:ngoFVIIM [Symbiodinium natans]|uniref:NgoFVIIM protein n=1 Tax=Symbiodinium natans TaxID=878477 RepID=A0A812IR11_9DINO|nr:ngoFVIIM [Symbiodinium natans]